MRQNMQEPATVGLSVDTQSDSSTVPIDVSDSDQTEGEAASSFTFHDDLDPGSFM